MAVYSGFLRCLYAPIHLAMASRHQHLYQFYQSARYLGPGSPNLYQCKWLVDKTKCTQPLAGGWCKFSTLMLNSQVKSLMVSSCSRLLCSLLPYAFIHPPIPLYQSFPNPSPRVNSVQQTFYSGSHLLQSFCPLPPSPI